MINKILKIVLTLLIIVTIVNISFKCGKEYNDYTKTVEQSKLYELPSVFKEDVNNFMELLKNSGIQEEKHLKRFRNIKQMYYTDLINMPVLQVTKDGSKVRAVAITYFDEFDGEILPYKIIFSDVMNYDNYFRTTTVFHELGHAVLLQDDIRSEYDNQLMWYKTTNDYCAYRDDKYFQQKIGELFTTPESDELKNRIRGINPTNKVHSCISHVGTR